MKIKSQYIFIFIILALAVGVYSNTLNNELVSDDIPSIVNNPQIAQPFYICPVSNLVTFSFSLNYLIGKFNPPIYHATNILIIAVSSLLVFFFLRLFFQPEASFLGALIFAAHPIHAEAITWISGRPYSLSALWMFAVLLVYSRATSAPKLKIPGFLLSLFLYILAMLSCTFALIFPAILVVYDFCRLPAAEAGALPDSVSPWEGWGAVFRRGLKNWRLWLAFMALTGLKFFSVRALVQPRVASLSYETGQTGLTNPIYNMAFSFFKHIHLLLWPAKLTLYHEPLAISQMGINLEIGAFVLLSILLPFIFRMSRAIFFSLVLFFLFLLPTYSPVMISWLVAERYLFFPSVALSMWLAFLVDQTAAKIRKNKKVVAIRPNKLVVACLLILVAGYSVRTIIRNRDWHTHASIWRATLAVSPLSPKVHNNMGDVYCRENNLQKGAEEFQRAIEIKPNYADAYHNLAHTYQLMGENDNAIRAYAKAVEINPRLWQSYENLGLIYYNQGLMGLAKECFLKAQSINPGDPQIRQLLESIR